MKCHFHHPAPGVRKHQLSDPGLLGYRRILFPFHNKANRRRSSSLKQPTVGISLVVQWLWHHLPEQGVQVHSLIIQLRGHMPHS